LYPGISQHTCWRHKSHQRVIRVALTLKWIITFGTALLISTAGDNGSKTTALISVFQVK
jgi:hypothetical protein